MCACVHLVPALSFLPILYILRMSRRLRGSFFDAGVFGRIVCILWLFMLYSSDLSTRTREIDFLEKNAAITTESCFFRRLSRRIDFDFSFHICSEIYSIIRTVFLLINLDKILSLIIFE